MKTIDTHELASRLAGGHCYIRTKGGEVKGLAVTIRDNPEAPEVIIVGDGPDIVSRAEWFLESGKSVPLYIKQGTHAWAYRGEYRATAFSRDPAVIEEYRQHRSAEAISGILFLEEAAETADPQGVGGWSTDPETRKAVEEAAVKRVWEHYVDDGYTVWDRQQDNCGYDLLATRGDEALRVEVKGTAGAQPAFWLTRNERAASVHPSWRLAVVTDALSEEPSEPAFFTAGEMEAVFDLEPYEWRAALKTQ